jgi:cell division protein FtsQ
MKVSRALKKTLFITLAAALAGYLVYAVFFMKKTEPDAFCAGMVLNITNSSGQDFIYQEKVDTILKRTGLYPVGKRMKDIDTRLIENKLQADPFIKNVECYKTVDHRVKMDVTQCTPVIYILPDSMAGYFLDENGARIPDESYSTNIIVASGTITPTVAKEQLVPFGIYLQQNKFWNDQIVQIYVEKDKDRKNGLTVKLIPRVGNQIITLGDFDDYEKKLAKLEKFYQQAMPKMGWDKYSAIDIRYSNQIICTKK